MVVTTTAVAFISLSLGLTVCGLWFLKAFKNTGSLKQDRKIGFLITSIFLMFGFNNGIIGVGTLLFAINSEALYFILIVSHFFLTLIAIVGVYTAYYIFSPRLSPYLGMLFTGILGAVGIITTIITHPQPYISSQNNIEWGYNFSLSLLVFYILFISIGSTVYIFGRLFLTAKMRQLKIFSLILFVLGVAGILLNFIRLVLLYNADTSVRNSIYDFGTVLMGAVFIVVLAITPIVKSFLLAKKTKLFGESKKKAAYRIKASCEEFSLPADGEKAVLFVHGFTGSPAHFREFADFIHSQGIEARVLRLPGHGTDVQDLAQTTYLDWRQAVHNELKELAKRKSKIYLLGYSFGSNLALDAAMHYPDLLAGLILISAPIFLRREFTLRFLAHFYDRYTNAEIKNKPWVRRKHAREYEEAGSYADIPVKSALDFFEFIDTFTKPHLKDVKAPCLILQAEQDPLVSAKSAKYIFNQLGSADKKLVTIDGNEHSTIADTTRRQAYEESLKFILQH